MRLFYTGAESSGDVQESALQSLGGYISQSPVQNGSFNNLFPEVAQLELLNGSVSTRLIALKNETGSDQTVSLFYENSPNSLSYYKMALVSPALDSCNRLYFETIKELSASPATGSFYDNKGESGSLSFPIADGAYVGIWIQRVTLKNKGEEYLTCESMLDRFDSGDTPSTIEYTNTDVSTNNYFTIGNIAIVMDSGLAAFDPPSGYEIVKVSYPDRVGDIPSDFINAKIDEVLVPRGILTRDGNVLTVDGLDVNPTSSSGFDIVFNLGKVNKVQEKMSIIIDY